MATMMIDLFNYVLITIWIIWAPLVFFLIFMQITLYYSTDDEFDLFRRYNQFVPSKLSNIIFCSVLLFFSCLINMIGLVNGYVSTDNGYIKTMLGFYPFWLDVLGKAPYVIPLIITYIVCIKYFRMVNQYKNKG